MGNKFSRDDDHSDDETSTLLSSSSSPPPPPSPPTCPHIDATDESEIPRLLEIINECSKSRKIMRIRITETNHVLIHPHFVYAYFPDGKSLNAFLRLLDCDTICFPQEKDSTLWTLCFVLRGQNGGNSLATKS